MRKAFSCVCPSAADWIYLSQQESLKCTGLWSRMPTKLTASISMHVTLYSYAFMPYCALDKRWLRLHFLKIAFHLPPIALNREKTVKGSRMTPYLLTSCVKEQRRGVLWGRCLTRGADTIFFFSFLYFLLAGVKCYWQAAGHNEHHLHILSL